ncbi:TIGR04222 domain-containing membrane protein [Streptomyces sp. I05A-00742]|uniref:TIGR04222 domain-containing membrane protein n=1 Tax=Streptomyces sp. I05A-00742 TaxID=2732853 RepID=UPI0014897F48|nr:TIGR04222 domain-containing membrane protein [Streptomyces sp. I05A-00742]
MWVVLLIVTCAVAVAACARLCSAAVAAARPRLSPAAAGIDVLTLYETAFLSGGPHRVTDLTLVSMARQRRLLLARTGWATVVDPVGRDEVERSVITAIGPGGQSPVPQIRVAHGAADAVRTLADRLTTAGLAVPAQVRREVSAAVRQVRAACALSVLTAAATLLTLPDGAAFGQAVGWLVLPLVLTGGCLAIAHYEVNPETHWASPAGRALLDHAPVVHPAGARDEQGLLTTLAVRGRRALRDPELRAALAETLAAHRY